jgi:hypothetical protein
VSKATRRIWQSYSDVTIKSSALMRIGAGIYTTHGARTAPNGGGGAANGIVAQQSGPVCVEEICEPLAADWPGWWFWGAERCTSTTMRIINYMHMRPRGVLRQPPAIEYLYF